MRVCKLLADHGGSVVIGNANACQDFNLTPTVVLNPLPDSALMSTEIMGPVLAVITYKTIDEAINFIKSKEKPMAIYYFGHNYINSNLTRVMNETSSGAFVVNECGYQAASHDLPFGGVG